MSESRPPSKVLFSATDKDRKMDWAVIEQNFAAFNDFQKQFPRFNGQQMPQAYSVVSINP